MNYKRGLGIGLIFIGLFVVLTSKIITGAVIGFRPENYLGLVGVLVFVVGVFLVLISRTLESEVEETPRSVVLSSRVPVVDKKQVLREIRKIGGYGDYEKLKEEYRFAESHGVKSSDDPKAWNVFYHAHLRGKKPDLDKGLDKGKVSRGGFYFSSTVADAIYALETQGFNREDLEVMKIKVSRNVYAGKPNQIIKEGGSPDLENDYYIPTRKFYKANELIRKGLIRAD